MSNMASLEYIRSFDDLDPTNWSDPCRLRLLCGRDRVKKTTLMQDIKSRIDNGSRLNYKCFYIDCISIDVKTEMCDQYINSMILNDLDILTLELIEKKKIAFEDMFLERFNEFCRLNGLVPERYDEIDLIQIKNAGIYNLSLEINKTKLHRDFESYVKQSIDYLYLKFDINIILMIDNLHGLKAITDEKDIVRRFKGMAGKIKRVPIIISIDWDPSQKENVTIIKLLD